MKNSTVQSLASFNDLRIDKLTEYISHSHHSYIKNALERLVVHSKTIVKVDAAIHPEVLQIHALVGELKDLVEQHVNFEEFILFPYIEKLLDSSDVIASKLVNNPIKKIREVNLKTTNLFKKVRHLSKNYTPNVNSSPSLKLCYAQLFDMEQDIHKQTFLEENILFPKLIELGNRKVKTKIKP